VYEENTGPVVEQFRERGNLVEIDGERPPDEVFADVRDAVEARES